MRDFARGSSILWAPFASIYEFWFHFGFIFRSEPTPQINVHAERRKAVRRDQMHSAGVQSSLHR